MDQGSLNMIIVQIKVDEVLLKHMATLVCMFCFVFVFNILHVFHMT